MRTRERIRGAVMSMLAISLVVLSCRELPSDPWTTELPSGSVQLIVNSTRNAEFNEIVSRLPRRTDLVTPSRFVVRTSSEWEVLWKQLRAPSPQPAVDFDSEMIVVEAIGRVAAPWEQVGIAGVMENSGQLYVLVLRYGSNPECVPAAIQAMVGSPVAMALVPKREGTPVYLERFSPIPAC